MPNDTTPVTANVLVILTTNPTKWITVIRRGSTVKEVRGYVYDWPIFEMTPGMFLVCVPERQVWLAERLASGLFYARVHDTYSEAEQTGIDNADLVMPR